jgi:hypothetical protein
MGNGFVEILAITALSATIVGITLAIVGKQAILARKTVVLLAQKVTSMNTLALEAGG